MEKYIKASLPERFKQGPTGSYSTYPFGLNPGAYGRWGNADPYQFGV